MRGHPLAIPLPLQLCSFGDFARSVDVYASTTDHSWIRSPAAVQRGASVPIMRGHPLAIPLPLRLYSFAEFTRGVNAYA